MNMSAVPCIVICFAFGGGNHILSHLVHLGVNLRTLTGEFICRAINKCYKTAVDLHADVDRPEFLHALELRIGVCLAALLGTARIGITHLQLPRADRQGNQSISTADYLIVCTGASNRDRCDILVVLNRIRRFKAVCDIHMIKLPLAHIIQVNVNNNGLNLFNIGSNDIRIPNRTEKNFVKRRILGYDFDRRLTGICLNIYLTNHRSIVALIIADREFDMVHTVCKNDIGK